LAPIVRGVPHKYVRIDGVATFLHHTGATTLPEAPPQTDLGETVLCLHGTGRHAGDFAALLEALADAHSGIAFDQPGHGRSGKLDSLGAVDRMRDFTRALSEKLALPPQVLLGHSLGAAVALEYALAFPNAVRGLVLCSAGTGFDFAQGFLANAKLVTEGKRRRDFDPAAFAKGADPKVMRRAFMAGMKTDPRATYGDLLACADWQPCDTLARITLPTLVLVGDAERAAVVARTDALCEVLPNARKAVIAKAGEMLLYEQPETVAEEVRGFLEGLS
jgi:pimeloyl-ACP methyl ester carboxylesterase